MAVVSWMYPLNNRILTCQVSWAESSSSAHTEISTDLMDAGNATISPLHPYTDYVVNVTCKYVTNGNWSDVIAEKFKTLTDVPERHPEVGGWFSEVDTKDDCTTVNIILKGLADEEKNSDQSSFDYTAVTHVIQPTRDSPCKQCPSSTTQNKSLLLKLVIPSNCDVRVIISSTNENGAARGEPAAITIPHKGAVPHAPRNMIQIVYNNSSVEVRWFRGAADKSTTGYTVFWRVAGKSYDFNTVGRDVNHLNRGHPYWTGKTQFGVSREVGNISTGIKWITCSYDQRYAPATPKYLKIVEGKLRWENSCCSRQACGYPDYYFIYIDKISDSTKRVTLYNRRNITHAMSGCPICDVKIPSLTAGSHYAITIQAVTSTKFSENSTALHIHTGIAILWYHIILALLGSGLLLLGCISTGWRIRDVVIKFSVGVRVQLPDKLVQPAGDEYQWNIVKGTSPGYTTLPRAHYPNDSPNGKPPQNCLNVATSKVGEEETGLLSPGPGVTKLGSHSSGNSDASTYLNMKSGCPKMAALSGVKRNSAPDSGCWEDNESGYIGSGTQAI